mgnify:CR=1 FL=1
MEEHEESSFFQSDDLFRLIRQSPDVEAVLLVAIARPQTAAGSGGESADAEEGSGHAESESLFPGGALLFRGQKPQPPQVEAGTDPDPAADLGTDPDPAADPPADRDAHAPADPGARWRRAADLIPNHVEETDVPGIGRVVGSLLALTFCRGKGFGRRFGRRTAIFGGPLLAEGSRLDRETRLRNLLLALTRRMKKSCPVLHVHNFRGWVELSPVFADLGFKPADNFPVLKEWESVDAAMDPSARIASPSDHAEATYRYEPARMKQYLERAVTGNGTFRRVNRPLTLLFGRLFFGQ